MYPFFPVLMDRASHQSPSLGGGETALEYKLDEPQYEGLPLVTRPPSKQVQGKIYSQISQFLTLLSPPPPCQGPQSHLRVINDLETIPLLEREVVRGPGFIVVQGHKKRNPS